MNPEDLAKILEALTAADVREFSLKTDGYDLNIKRGAEVGPVAGAVAAAPATASAPVAPPPAPAPTASAPATAPAPAPAPQAPAKTGSPVKAPIVGTFYSASSPDAAPFVQVGDRVEVGQIMCIIEAMKLMNEIEAEVSGTVRQVLVGNAEPVEYGQSLFVIEP